MNIGIDIGGSHIGIGLVDSKGNIINKIEKELTCVKKEDIKNCLETTIINCINNFVINKNIHINKIGIGVPGIIKNGEIRYSVNLGIYNYNLYDILKKSFPNIDISIKNDGKCAGLAEKKLGALKEFDDCVFFCFGTGIGGAAFYNGEMLIPKRSFGFEFGHMIVQKDGELCRCGSKGCFERYGSMRKFKQDIRKKLNLSNDIDGEQLLKIIIDNAHNDNIKNIIDEYIDNICIGISNIVNILEPQAICLGGSFAYYKDILLEKFKDKFYNSNYLFYQEEMPEIVIANLGNDAGIIGSALYA